METGSGERPVAAVLDASLFDKGKLRNQSVSRLAQDLGKRGFELWIPRQIVFEWAAHAKPDVAALRTTYKAAQDAGLVASQELPSSDAADLAESIERVCRAIPNVTVLQVLFVVDCAFFVFIMAMTTYVSRIAPPSEHTPTLSMGVAMNHVSAVLMPLVGGLLWRAFGPRWAFLAGAAAAVISIAVATLVPAKKPRSEPAADPP